MVIFTKNCIKHFFKNNEIVFLILIFLIGLFLRTYNILNNTQWFSDTARDILTAKHLIEYPGSKYISPASSIGSGLNNTPMYYWILSVLWLLFKSENILIISFAILGSLNIIIAYILSKQLFPKGNKLIFPLFIAFSNRLIEFSRSVWQPHLIPLLQIITFIYIYKGAKDKNKNYYLIAIQFSFLSMFLHYSFLPLLLAILIYIYLDLYFLKKYEFCIKVIILSLINILVYILLTQSNFGITGEAFSKDYLLLFQNFLTSLSILTRSFAFFASNLEIVLFYLSFIIPTIYILIKKKSKQLFLTFFFLISIALTSFFGKKNFFHYINPYYTIVLIFYSYIINEIQKKSKIFSIVFTILLIFLITDGNSYYLFYKNNELRVSKNIASEIINNSPNIDNLIVYTCIKNEENNCLCPECSSGGIWYYLELISKKRLGYIKNNLYENYLPYSTDNKDHSVFFICNYDVNHCFSNFSDNKLYKIPTVIYSEGEYTLSSIEEI